MYRWSLAPKNCVVTISPSSPYHWGSDQSAGSFWNAPGGCLSKPTTRPTSCTPDWSARTAADERRASRGASVLHVGEREAGRAEVGDHRVGVAAVLTAAVGELHVAPGEPRVGERFPHRVHAHPQTLRPPRAGRTDGSRHRRPRSRSCRCERVGQPACALDRHDPDLHADLEPLRVGLRKSPFDAEEAGELDVPDTVRLELSARRRTAASARSPGSSMSTTSRGWEAAPAQGAPPQAGQ